MTVIATAPEADESSIKLFLCWAAGMLLLLTVLAFGLMPVVVASMPEPDELRMNIVVNLTSAALAMEVAAFTATLFAFSRTDLTFASSFGIFVSATIFLIVLGLAAVWVAAVGAFLATMFLIIPFQWLSGFFQTRSYGLTGEIFVVSILGIFGILAAFVFGRILFTMQKGIRPIDAASATLWRSAHRWGLLPYVLLAFYVDGFSKNPTAMSVIACLTAIPHIVLTAIAASRSKTIYFNQSYMRLPLFLAAAWIFVALILMPRYGKAENALLWPLRVAGASVDGPVWAFGKVPDRDGLVTFRQKEFRFRARPEQITMVYPKSDGQSVVSLSLDRREFGPLEPPGKSRITCSQGTCVDICGWAVPPWPDCPDLNRGWYRVTILPAAHSWGADPRPLNQGPRSGPGHRCADAGKPGLELCWDPNRITPQQTLSEVREVSYPGLRGAAAHTWISRELDGAGRPVFVANCAVNDCQRSIEWAGARLEIGFHLSELDDWKRFDAGVFDFAKRLLDRNN